MKNVKIYILILLLLFVTTAWAEVIEEKSSVTFVLHSRFDRSSLDRSYMDNGKILDSLHRVLEVISDDDRIEIITIRSLSSPDGNGTYNKQLSQMRALEVQTYLKREYPHIGERIFSSGDGENWNGLLNLALKDTLMPYRGEVLSVIDTEADSELRKRRLTSLAGGQPWRYASNNMFRHLRTTTINIIIREEDVSIKEKIVPKQDEIQVVHLTDEAPHLQQEQATDRVISMQRQYHYIRPIAFKTNLLFDAVGALNVELEVPVSSRLSVAMQFISPWWLWSARQHCFELQYGTVELRYWFKPNYKYHQNIKGGNPLTGWFAGAYYGAGLLDLEYNKKGYQGETYLSTGISAGYVAPVSKSLNFEFSLSGGYIKSDYRYYEAKQDVYNNWHLIKQYDGKYSHYGLTGAKVSLVWYPTFRKEIKK